ncbi:sulfite exporter TauE/SafE family protein [Pseudoalteromonas xiamenensis]
MLQALFGATIIGLSLGVFGSGGSILTVPILMYLLDVPAPLAIASSLAIVAGISFGGSIFNVLKRQVSYRHLIWFGLPGMFGTYFGAWFGSIVGSRVQLFVFVVLMSIAAVFMWRGRKESTSTAVQPLQLLLLEGFVVGVVTGFVGVGGGFLIVPALMFFAGLPMLLATGTSLMIIAMNSSSGFVKYYELYSAQAMIFDWALIGVMVFGGILGSLFGSRLSTLLPKQWLQKGFAVFLLAMSGFVFMRSVYL